MKRFRSYGFWTALAGALTMLLAAIGKSVGIAIDGGIVNEIVMAFAGLLVVLGVVIMPPKENKSEEIKSQEQENTQNDENKETQQENDETKIDK